jgi:2-polyprenyl-6-methoxyphenol hydroxylase-like FAD-dependent oxidoreductase
MSARRRVDVAIVGARCAGAALATLLARAGASVVVVEKDALHTDQVLSTHTIHPAGLDVLDEIGVGAAVRAVAPPSRTLRLAKNEAFVDMLFADGRAEYCPRRQRLDGLLQDAASAAGAEVRERTRVVSLLQQGDRVVGVRTADQAGQTHDIPARLVVGADGRHSTIAKLVQAEEYLGYDAPRALYWAYWNAPPAWREMPFDFYVGNRRGSIRAVFQTDHNQLLIASAPPVSEIGKWRHDAAAALTRDLLTDPVTGPLVDHNPPDGDVRGTVKERYFFRQSAGPGWVLVGDAGHHKEFVIGDGITEALIQVRSLTQAIREGTDAALVRWWRARDVEALPYFYFGKDEGALGAPLRIQEIVFRHANQSLQLRTGLGQVAEHTLSPYDVFPVATVLRWTLGAAFRGSPGVLRDFLTMGKRGALVARELKTRRALLARAVE